MVFVAARLRHVLVAVVVAAVAAGAGAAWVGHHKRRARATPEPRHEVLSAVQRILAERAQALVQFDDGPLTGHYDLKSVYGQWSLEHEQRRLRYLRAWSEKRGVRLVSAAVSFRTPAMRLSENEAWVSVVQSMRLGYVYDGDRTLEKHIFGIGTRHAMQLVRAGSGWVLRRDWYTDPLDEDTLIPEVSPADVSASGGILASLARLQELGSPRCAPPVEARLAGSDALGEAGRVLGGGLTGLLRLLGLPRRPPAPEEEAAARSYARPAAGRAAGRRYHREAAVAYATEFCGAAWGCGNGGRYNPLYRDYTDIGGDCTNFTSQVLHAGGLPMDSVWYYRRGSGGSAAWVQTTALVDHLLATGRAQLIARGRYPEVMRPAPRFPQGAVAALEPGDVIGYQEKGRIVHLAPVTGKDFRGYVLVNSHTADRNRVPWDVGWDQATVFWLLKVRD